MGKKILIAILALLLVIQFFGIEKNVSGNEERALSKKYFVPENVSKVMTNACYDCHSNKTEYPWYSRIQPVAWWLNHHVNEGKEHFNLSEFIHLPIAVQHHKLEEFVEEIKEEEMPLPSYTWFGLHNEADLSDDEKKMLVAWAEHQTDSLKSIYPADSLKMKRRGPKPD